MTLDEIKFPIYVIGTEDVETVDNVVFAEGRVVDDKNMRKMSNIVENLIRRHVESRV